LSGHFNGTLDKRDDRLLDVISDAGELKLAASRYSVSAGKFRGRSKAIEIMRAYFNSAQTNSTQGGNRFPHFLAQGPIVSCRLNPEVTFGIVGAKGLAGLTPGCLGRTNRLA
jgi:hypothetical protein